MSKATTRDKALALVKRESQKKDFQQGYEEKETDPQLRTVFTVAPLSNEDSKQLQQILEKSAIESQISNEQVDSDHKNLLHITTEIRAIEKQSALLHGERINKAQQILKKYRDGTFTNWLLLAYGNRQTPYSWLQFYELFQRLEKDEQSKISSMPKKAAYVLAGRNGALEKKVAIIKEHYESSRDEIIQVVQETFPLAEEDKRKASKRVSDADLLREILPKIRRLTYKKSLQRVLDLAEKLLAEPTPVEEDPDQIDMFYGSD